MQTDGNDKPRRGWKLRLVLWTGLFLITLPFIPIAAIIAAISVIGIPLAIVLWIAPSLIILAAAVDLGRDAFPRFPQPVAAIVSIAACVVLSLIAAAIANTGIDLEMRALVQGDHDAAAQAPPISVIAVIGIDDNSRKKKSKRKNSRSRNDRCDRICAEILLSRPTMRVIRAHLPRFNPESDKDAEATMFHRAVGAVCADAFSDPNSAHARFARFSESRTDAPGRLFAELKAANGCLAAKPARIADADAVFAYGAIQRGEGAYGAGLDLFADKITAERILIAHRKGDRFDTAYRLTAVRAWKFALFLYPAVVDGGGLNTKVGFPRRMVSWNYPDDHRRLDEIASLRERLGIDLSEVR